MPITINRIGTNAIGEDGIPAIFIKKLSPLIVPFITYIVNNCLMKSYFPQLWKVANVKAIPKISNPTAVSDFRPISILPALSKVVESILKSQMQQFVSDHKLLFEMQSGFRPGHSTTTAMLRVTDDLSTALEREHVVALVLLDFKKAFDLVNHSLLLSKLRDKFNFSLEACKLLKSCYFHYTSTICLM